MRLYHGTPLKNLDSIQDKGLFGGDNCTGGNHGVWKIPLLFMTPDRFTAEKYGEIVSVEVDINDLPDRIIDNAGNVCYVFEQTTKRPIFDYQDVRIPAFEFEAGFLSEEEYGAW